MTVPHLALLQVTGRMSTQSATLSGAGCVGSNPTGGTRQICVAGTLRLSGRRGPVLSCCGWFAHLARPRCEGFLIGASPERGPRFSTGWLQVVCRFLAVDRAEPAEVGVPPDSVAAGDPAEDGQAGGSAVRAVRVSGRPDAPCSVSRLRGVVRLGGRIVGAGPDRAA